MRFRFVLATVLAVIYAVLAWDKLARDVGLELLWTCHLATALMILGLVVGSRHAVAIGTLFHLTVGFPAFFIQEAAVYAGVMNVPPARWTSWVMHLVTPSAGLVALSGRPFPRFIALWTLGLQWLSVVLARFLTPPVLNVNIAHGSWGPAQGWLPEVWQFHVANSVVCLALLLAMGGLVRWGLGKLVREPADLSAPADGAAEAPGSSGPSAARGSPA